MKTFSPRPADVKREWLIIDAKDYVLGRLAAPVAAILRGKHKTTFAPHMNMGDIVVVINAEKIKVTGKKETDKPYYRHTGYPGGIKHQSLREVRQKNPEQLIKLAVKRMLPKGPLGRDMFRNLMVYAGNEHPHQAQKPRELILDKEKVND